jgi:hypothetical protein
VPFPNQATQWKPGQTGNPNGRPRKGIITGEAVDYLLEMHPKHDGKTRARVIAERMVDMAETDPDAREKLLDRVEGKPTQSVEASVTTHDDRTADDPELDGYAVERARALAQKADREAKSGGVRGDGEPGAVDMGAASGPAERPADGRGGGEDQPPADHDAAPPWQE